MELRNAEIEAAIRADPDAAAPYAIYGDWLAEQGEPHGELVAVQLAREANPADAELAAREKQLLAETHLALLGRVTDNRLHPRVEVTWRRGFIYAAEVHTTYSSQDGADVYPELMRRPVTQFLRELRLGVACTSGGGGDRDVSILRALHDHPPPLLRKLAFDAFDFELSWTHVGALAIANRALAPVEHLEVISGDVALGAIEMPRLRTFRIETGGLRPNVTDSIARAAWPALESLVLYFGTPDYGGDCTASDTVAVLAGANLPRVTTLGLCNSMFGDELVENVVRAPILPRLRHLDLSKGTIGADGAKLLAKHADVFAHLESLDLSGNYFSKKQAAALEHIARRVDVSGQKLESGYGRFVTVSE